MTENLTTPKLIKNLERIQKKLYTELSLLESQFIDTDPSEEYDNSNKELEIDQLVEMIASLRKAALILKKKEPDLPGVMKCINVGAEKINKGDAVFLIDKKPKPRVRVRTLAKGKFIITETEDGLELRCTICGDIHNQYGIFNSESKKKIISNLRLVHNKCKLKKRKKAKDIEPGDHIFSDCRELTRTMTTGPA